MTPVFVADTPSEAELIAGLLAAHGIATTIRGDDPWGSRNDWSTPGVAPTVFALDDHQAPEAQAIIAAYRTPVAEPGSDHVQECPSCGHDLDVEAPICESCGAAIPGRA